MSDFSENIELVKSVFADVGAAELSRVSGVPYMTIKDSAERGFRPKPVTVLEKLVEAARKIRADAA
jgi:hypothetical protein